MTRRLRSLAALGLCWLCGGLLGAWPGEAGAASAVPVPVTVRIRELEADGRGHPLAASEALERLLPTTAESSPARLELLTVEGVILATASMNEGAHRTIDRLEAWGRDASRPHAESAAAAALLVRARVLTRGGDLKQADALLRTAIAKLPADFSTVDRYRFVFARAYVAAEAGRLEDAVRLNHEAVALADRQDALWRQSEARSTLAYSYYNASQHEQAARIAADAVALSEKARDWVSLARAYNAEGIAADGLNDRAGERRAFEAAIEAARRADSKLDEVRFLANLADFFLQTAAYPTALRYAELALPLARELHDRNTEIVALSNIGLAQISMHQKELGLRSVQAATDMEEKRGSLIGVADSWRNAGLYLERAGDLADAVDAYHRYRRILTSVLRVDQQKAILAMQEQYDADNRSRALRLLGRENDIKAEQLQRRELRLGVGALFAVIFLLSFVGLGLLYRQVRRTNRRLARQNEKLKVQGERDPLTGLGNRRHFQSAMRRLEPGGRLQGSAFLIDLDHFKSINDRIGHAAGDAVLAEAARRLRHTLRDDDLLVRWGGEEFLAVVQGLDPARVEALAQRLLWAVEDRPVAVGAARVRVTGSIGFASFPLGEAGLEASCEQAVNLVDAAMYLAKAAGRNRACGVVELAGEPLAGRLDAALSDLDAAVRGGRARVTLLQGANPAAAVPAALAGRAARVAPA